MSISLERWRKIEQARQARILMEQRYGLPDEIGEENCSADLDWKEEGEALVAGAFLHARKRGDEIMALYTQTLQGIANRTGKTVISREVPCHQGAVRLFQRTPGYKRIQNEKDPNRLGTYERIFQPEIIGNP